MVQPINRKQLPSIKPPRLVTPIDLVNRLSQLYAHLAVRKGLFLRFDCEEKNGAFIFRIEFQGVDSMLSEEELGIEFLRPISEVIGADPIDDMGGMFLFVNRVAAIKARVLVKGEEVVVEGRVKPTN